EDDVRAPDRSLRARLAVELDRVLDAAFPLHSGGVDDEELATVALEAHVDRVARRPGHLADDHPLLPSESVHEGRLAGVLPPDDREGHHGLDRHVSRRSEPRDDLLEDVAPPVAVHRAHRMRLTEPEL